MKNLSEIKLPKQLKTIGYGAFQYCTGLQDLTIPEYVTSIDNCAFNGCENLKQITLLCPDAPSINPITFSSTIYKNAKLIVPYDCAEIYRTADHWNNFTNIEEMPSSSVNNIETDTITIGASNGKLVISNAKATSAVRIYSSNGLLLYNSTVEKLDEITLTSGLYLVTINGQCHKIII